jgi:hypothetical protein
MRPRIPDEGCYSSPHHRRGLELSRQHARHRGSSLPCSWTSARCRPTPGLSAATPHFEFHVPFGKTHECAFYPVYRRDTQPTWKAESAALERTRDAAKRWSQRWRLRRSGPARTSPRCWTFLHRTVKSLALAHDRCRLVLALVRGDHASTKSTAPGSSLSTTPHGHRGGSRTSWSGEPGFLGPLRPN